MAEVRFYHLHRSGLEGAITQMLAKTRERGQKAVVMLGSEDRIEALSNWLWSHDSRTFLAHGTPSEGHAEEQPIWLTLEDERPNGAEVLFLADGAESAEVSGYGLVCELFDGRDADAVSAARERWKAYKAAGHDVTYWQQDDEGRWSQKG